MPAARVATPATGELASKMRLLRGCFRPEPAGRDLQLDRLRATGLSAAKESRRNGPSAAHSRPVPRFGPCQAPNTGTRFDRRHAPGREERLLAGAANLLHHPPDPRPGGSSPHHLGRSIRYKCSMASAQALDCVHRHGLSYRYNLAIIFVPAKVGDRSLPAAG
jgi:hypothetical protein